jgi:phenylacetaldehyde dehydrogenase
MHQHDDDLDAVAKFANDTEYGLQASVWTQNLKVAHVMARKIKAGTICINNHNFGDPACPSSVYLGQRATDPTRVRSRRSTA